MEHNRKGDQIHWSELVLSLPPSIDSVPSLFLARPFLSPNQNNYRQVLTQEIINEIRRFFLRKSQLWRSRSSHSKLVEVAPVASSAYRPACRSQTHIQTDPFSPFFSRSRTVFTNKTNQTKKGDRYGGYFLAFQRQSVDHDWPIDQRVKTYLIGVAFPAGCFRSGSFSSGFDS